MFHYHPAVNIICDDISSGLAKSFNLTQFRICLIITKSLCVALKLCGCFTGSYCYLRSLLHVHVSLMLEGKTFEICF